MARVISAPAIRSVDSSKVGDAYSSGGIHGRLAASECPEPVRDLRQRVDAGSIPRGALRTNAMALTRGYELARNGAMKADGIVDNCRNLIRHIDADPRAPRKLANGLTQQVLGTKRVRTKAGEKIVRHVRVS